MIGHDGSVLRSCGCPNTPEKREYAAANYSLFAETQRDSIWVDDDILWHHQACPLSRSNPGKRNKDGRWSSRTLSPGGHWRYSGVDLIERWRKMGGRHGDRHSERAAIALTEPINEQEGDHD